MLREQRVAMITVGLDDGTIETYHPEGATNFKVYQNFKEGRKSGKVVESWTEFSLTWRQDMVSRND